MDAAFIGLGDIGSEIASNLVKAGLRLRVHDIRAEACAALEAIGAFPTDSPAAAVRDADFASVCVRDDAEVGEAIEGPNGIMAGARPGLRVLIHSTIRLDTLRRIAAGAAAPGARIVDAPVSRVSRATGRGGIVFMLAGDPEDVRAAADFVRPSAARIIEAGELGAAMALKLCNNLLTYLSLVSANEAMDLAEAAGLDISLLAEITASNGIASPHMLSAFARRSSPPPPVDDPSAELERLGVISEKDLDCALDAARSLGLNLPAVAMARGEIRRAFAARLGLREPGRGSS